MMADGYFSEEQQTPAEKIIDSLDDVFKTANTAQLADIFADITTQTIAGDQTIAPAVKGWVDKKRDALTAQAVTLQGQLLNFYNFLEKIDAYFIKLPAHHTTEKFLQNATARGLLAESAKPNFTEMATDPNLSFKDYLLSVLPTYKRILGDATDEQVAAIADMLPTYCTQLQTGLTEDFTLHGAEKPHDYIKAFEGIFLLRATATFRIHVIHVQTPQMEAATCLWRSITAELSVTGLLNLTTAELDTHTTNICQSIQAMHMVDKHLDDVCKPLLPTLKESTQSLIDILTPHQEADSEAVAEGAERLHHKLNFNGLHILTTCEESTAPNTTPWITLYSNVISQLTYGVHLLFKELPDSHAELKIQLISDILTTFQKHKTIDAFFMVFQVAVQKFVETEAIKEAADRVEDTAAFFAENLNAAQGFSALRTNINIYTLATTFYLHTTLAFRDLGIAAPEKDSTLGLQDHLTQLHNCWKKHPQLAASTATSAHRLGHRQAATDARAAAARAAIEDAARLDGGGGGGKPAIEVPGK